MCTIVAIKSRRAHYPLVVGANRDEYYARPSTPPRVVSESPRAVAGVDLTKGGSWMGANEHGIFVALTNQRTHRGADPRRASRGEIVMEALAQATVEAIDALLTALDPRDFNSFNVIYGDARTLKVAYARNERTAIDIDTLEDGLWVLTNDRIGSPEFPKAERALSLAGPISHSPWEELSVGLERTLADHEKPPLSHVPEPPPDSRFDHATLRELQALCIHTPIYGTRSATVLALEAGGVAHYLHADGPPGETPVCDVTGLVLRGAPRETTRSVVVYDDLHTRRSPMRPTHARLLALTLAFVPGVAHAQVPLVDMLGGPRGYGPDCLGPNDDGSSMAIDITPVFPTGVQFFGATHTTMYVNTNGNITFDDGVAAYTPAAFPIAMQAMIAPFWADVDTRPSGLTCGGYPDGSGAPTYTYAGDCMNPADNGVWWALDPDHDRIVVTWDRVGYFRCHTDKRMSFQLILSRVDGTTTCGGGGDFDVEFRYNRCEWSTGDASGGLSGDPRPDTACVRRMGGFVCPVAPQLACTGPTHMCSAVPGQAGFDAGNLADFVEIPGSRTAEIDSTLCTMSNVDMPGIWQFQIRSGVVVCPDAGAACDTGMPGVCGPGRTQCIGGGTECRPDVTASPERCDALDNDCNGVVDDGTLCDPGQTCTEGVCVGACFELGCPDGQTCRSDGLCVDSGCETITCPDGERCVAGSCVAACDGIVCPAGLECRAGRCVDLCADATCDTCTVCENGDCVANCHEAPCPSGQTCQADGHCVESACASVSCDPGFVCQGGSCVDACAGAVCPGGQHCDTGSCVLDMPDGGVPQEDAGVTPRRDAGPTPLMPDSGTNMPGVDAGTTPPTENGGCGCIVAGSQSSSAGWMLSILAIGIAAWRRRARR